jgi:hypothetical protein
MNNSSISRLFVVLFGLIFSLYVMVESITSRSSVLGKLYLFFAIAAFILGVVKPKTAIYALIFCTAYIDFFKRLIVIAGQPTNFDVACSLATPPLLCAGALVNLVLSVVMRRIKVSRSIIYSFIFSILILFATYITSNAEGVRGIGTVVNYAMYPFLLVLIPVYFSDINDKVKLFKITYIIFIVVALYMIKHGIYGLADFEYDYLLTNLSQEVRILVEGAHMRCFSTMNGAATVSVMCGLMFFWSFVNLWKKSFLNQLLFVACAMIYLVASYYTLSRTGWVCAVVALVSYFLFLRWKTTVATYVIAFSSITLLVVTSPIIKEMKLTSKLEDIMKDYTNTSDSRVDQAMTLGTFNGRIEGWVSLMTRERIWSPFGWRIAKITRTANDVEFLGDDVIFWYIITYGYIPFFTGLFLFLLFMYKLHRFVCFLPKDSVERRICTICLATTFGILSGGLSNASQLSVFPINIYFYLCLSVVYSIYIQRIKVRKISVNQPTFLEKNSTPIAVAS